MIQINGTIFDIRKYSIHDGPGIRTAVFFKGCPLRCAWCHNPESQSFAPELILHPNRCILCAACVERCPSSAVNGQLTTDRERCQSCGGCVDVCYADAREIVGREMTVAQVLGQIEADQVFYDQSNGGVTFTGGEPLSQPRFLLDLLAACRPRNIHTAVDTSGFAAWTVVDQIRPLVDLFLYDLKLIDDEQHRQYTGVSNQLILSNLQQLSELGHNLIVRIPIIPGVNDDEKTLRQMGEFLASLAIVPPVELLAYHQIAAAKYANLGREYSLSGLIPPDKTRMEDIAGLLNGYVSRVFL